jgi:hypothetical protein
MIIERNRIAREQQKMREENKDTFIPENSKSSDENKQNYAFYDFSKDPEKVAKYNIKDNENSLGNTVEEIHKFGMMPKEDYSRFPEQASRENQKKIAMDQTQMSIH